MLSAYKLMVVLAVVGSLSACTRNNDSKKAQGRTEIGTGGSQPAPEAPKTPAVEDDEQASGRDGTRTQEDDESKRPAPTPTPGDLPGAVGDMEVELKTGSAQGNVSQSGVTASTQTSTTPEGVATQTPQSGTSAKPEVTAVQTEEKVQNQQSDLQNQISKQVGEFSSASSDGLRQDLVRSIMQKPAIQQQAIFDVASKVENADLDINYENGSFVIQLLLKDGSNRKAVSLCGKLDGDREGKICSTDGVIRVSGKLKC